MTTKERKEEEQQRKTHISNHDHWNSKISCYLKYSHDSRRSQQRPSCIDLKVSEVTEKLKQVLEVSADQKLAEEIGPNHPVSSQTFRNQSGLINAANVLRWPP